MNRSPLRRLISKTMLSTSCGLSNSQTLLTSSKRIVSGASRLPLYGVTTLVLTGSGITELLGKRRALAEDWAFPVDHVNRNDQDERDAEEDCGRICEMVFTTDIYSHVR
jgi:hypothetical protein